MLDDQGVGAINDNDANGPTEGIAVSDFTVNEDAGTAQFTISYTGNTVQDTFNVNFSVTEFELKALAEINALGTIGIPIPLLPDPELSLGSDAILDQLCTLVEDGFGEE